jgi:hypothetical protein
MRRLVLAFFVLFLVSGCASLRQTPQPPQPKPPRPNSPYVLYVEPVVRVGGALANNREDTSFTQGLALDLQESLYKRILVTPERTAYIVTDNYDTLWTYLQAGKTVYQISCTLTNYEKGNGLLRYLLGDWPTWYSDDYAICDYMSGYVALQADCTVTDLGKKTQVLQFSAKQKYSGNPHGGLNFFVFSSDYVAGKTTRLLADQLITKLADQL